MTTNKYSFFLLIFLSCFAADLSAQNTVNYSPGKILQDIKELNVLKSVLYIGAHPDDENNRLIAYLANEELAEVGYLSLTRGDGGQNLIGREMREELGILRTQELLGARRIDGGQQYFATANDFGFSKNPEETFTIWDKEKILADMVWVIRKTRPDVLITRFSHLPANTHGHHTASAILAYEAFDASADPKRFPEQLKYVETWQAKRLLWNTGPGRFSDSLQNKAVGIFTVNTGKYNTFLGKSYGELAAESRSNHKCQGMGTQPERGEVVEYFQNIKGNKAARDIFEGINTGWQRLNGAGNIEKLITFAYNSYKPQNPSLVVPQLLTILSEIEKLPESRWKTTKAQAVKEVIREALGLYLEATANDFSVTPGERLKINIEVVNRSGLSIKIKEIELAFANQHAMMDSILKNNTVNHFEFQTKINNNIPYSQPYWLEEKGSLGAFVVKDQQNVGLAENPPALTASVTLQIKGRTVSYSLPVIYKHLDPIAGELYQPVSISPPVYVDLTKKTYIFSTNESQKIQVKVKSGTDNIRGSVKLKVSKDWLANPAAIQFEINNKGSEQLLEFIVSPPADAGETELQAEAIVDNNAYDQGFSLIKYDHIPSQVYFPKSNSRAVKLDMIKAGKRIAYIKGAGDLVAESLQQAGYEVTQLNETQLTDAYLAGFNAVVIGVRAYNINPKLDLYKEALLTYVRNGGNIIVQYNTDFDLPVKNFGPYPFEISGETRVTDEHSPLTFINPVDPVLNFPNKITKADFSNWVQERGSYFPIKWDKGYEPIISLNDAGEASLNGSLLVAKIGKGYYVYTTLSWFRQLPAGVPGAYRLFANLLGLGENPAVQK